MSYLIIQSTINGLLVGSIYALMAVGLTLEFGILKVVNFGFGALYMLGGLTTYSIVSYFGLNFWLSLACSCIVLFLVGMIVEKVGFSRFRDNELATLVFGVGLMIGGRAVIMLFWGAEGRGIEPPLPGMLLWRDYVLSLPRLLAALVALTSFALLALFLKKTTLGKVMRCVSDSSERAATLGINSAKIYMIAMGVGTAMGTIAASVTATVFVVGPEIDMVSLFKSFIIIVLAGLGSIPGALIGGLILGLVEAYAMSMLSVTWGIVIPFAILVISLIIRPQGLFGKTERVG